MDSVRGTSLTVSGSMDLFPGAGEEILRLETLSGLAEALGFAWDDCKRLSALEMPVSTLVLFCIEVTGFLHGRIDLCMLGVFSCAGELFLLSIFLFKLKHAFRMFMTKIVCLESTSGVVSLFMTSNLHL